MRLLFAAFVLLLSVLFLPPTNVLAEGLLKNFEGKMTDGVSSTPSSTTPNPIWNDPDSAELMAYLVLIPFVVPNYLVEGGVDTSALDFESYPFDQGQGFLEENSKKSTLVRFGSGVQKVSSGTLGYRGEIQAYYQRLGIETAYTRYEEKLGMESDFLSFGEVIATFSFAQSENWQWRAGLGYQGFDGAENHGGTKAVYRIRYFQKPIQFKLDMGVTWGFSHLLTEIAPGMGIHWGPVEAALCYRSWFLDGTSIHGPEASISLWY